MTFLFTIIFTALILWWLIAKELPSLFGMLVPTSAIRRRWFVVLFVTVVAVAMLMPMSRAMGERFSANYPMGTNLELLLVGMSVLLTLVLLDRFGMIPSLCTATLGALEAHRVLVLDAPMFDYSLMASWVVAPVVSMLLSALFFAVYRFAIGRSHIHLIRLSVVMRYVIIAGIALVAFAVGWNNGSLLLAQGSLLMDGWLLTVATPMAMFVLAMVLFARLVDRLTDLCAEQYMDLTTQNVVSVTYAVAFTMLIFSTDVVRGVGLSPSPLGITTLLLGAFAGVSLVAHRNIRIVEVWQPLVGIVLTPLVSILFLWLLSLLFAGGVTTGEEINITILACALMLVLVVLFGRYVRRQEKLRDSSKRLILSQQQQLYENQKALNALEMKTILAENSSLHSTLELKRKEIVNVALSISEQKEFLEMLAEKVHRAAKSSSEEKDRLIAELEKDLSQRTSFSGEIDEFYTQAEMLHKDFSVKLTEEFPNLTTSERRLATLLRLGFSSKYIATLMNISPKSVEISRYRLRQKLGLQKGDNLIHFIKSI